MNGSDMNYCTYNKTVTGRCENNTYGKDICSYHDKVLQKLIEPSDQVTLLKTLPSMRGEKQ